MLNVMSAEWVGVVQLLNILQGKLSRNQKLLIDREKAL